MEHKEIAYQNKDITSKMLAENFKGKTFRVYGLNLPEIQNVLPTNIPAVKDHELRIDNIFELADGTSAIVDYESTYSQNDKVKYLNYLTGIANRYLTDKKDCPFLRMIVIYTADLTREQVSSEYNIGALHMNVECAFLSELNSDEIYQRLKQKVEKNEMLEDEELMEFIILPLSYHTKEEKQQKIQETVELATKIQDRKQQLFTLAGILAFTDKLIDHKTAAKIRRVIEMTQVAQIFEEEKQQALTQVAQIFEEEKQQALIQMAQNLEEEKQQALSLAAQNFAAEKQQAVKNTSKQIIIRMIRKGYSSAEISSLTSDFSPDDIDTLREELMNTEDTQP